MGIKCIDFNARTVAENAGLTDIVFEYDESRDVLNLLYGAVIIEHPVRPSHFIEVKAGRIEITRWTTEDEFRAMCVEARKRQNKSD